jgi:hypothetical protein
VTIIVDTQRALTGGVDTHADVHVAAVIDPEGGLLGVKSFATNLAGYKLLSGWMGTFGEIGLVGVEGTGPMERASLVTSLERGSWSSKSIGPTAKSVPGRESPTHSMPLRQLGPRCLDAPSAWPKAATGTSKPFALSWWRGAAHESREPRP